jgi:hypothetical protein
VEDIDVVPGGLGLSTQESRTQSSGCYRCGRVVVADDKDTRRWEREVYIYI